MVFDISGLLQTGSCSGGLKPQLSTVRVGILPRTCECQSHRRRRQVQNAKLHRHDSQSQIQNAGLETSDCFF